MFKNKSFKGIVSIIGTILIYVSLISVFIYVNLKYVDLSTNEKTTDIFEVIWDTIWGPFSASVAIVDLCASCLFIRFVRPSKFKVISFSIITYLMIIFNNIAIKYPLSVSLTACINCIILCLIVILALSIPNNFNNNDSTVPAKNNKLQKLIEKTSNKKIIGVQLYRVKSSSINIGGQEKIRYEVSLKESFARSGYDINSISSIVYEMDRELVDGFQTMLTIYQNFIDDGEQFQKDKITNQIKNQTEKLRNKLKEIDEQGREITKEDCCIARMLILYLSFQNKLSLDTEQNEYIGEISVNENDFQLKKETVIQLYTLVRTGILGAILLDEETRHVFKYRKNGIKNGRLYCCSQLKCKSDSTTKTDVNQIMDLALYTVENDKSTTIPPYLMRCIKNSELQIIETMNKINSGGDDNAKKPLAVTR